MKIAFFMYSILELGGGLEKYFIETSSNLTNKYKHNADIITLDETYTKKLVRILSFYYFSKTNINDIKRESTESIINKLGNSKYINIKTFRELKETLLKYDVIYSKNELLEAFFLKFFIGYKNLPPIIFGVHTPHYYPVTKSVHSKIHNWLYCGPLYNFLCSGIVAFHTSNQQSYEILSKQFRNKKIFLINYPFDTDRFCYMKEDNSFKARTNKNTKNILWLARLTEQKGIEDLVKLIMTINTSEQKNKVTWHIAGSGQPSYEEQLTQLANEYANVIYYKHIQNNYVPDLMSQMDLFLSSSKWEVSPFNVMEAQAMDVPVISYKIAGPNDIIINKETGLLSENYEELLNNVKGFIDSKYKFQNISGNLKCKFDPKVIYPQLVEMFEKNAKKT